MGIRLSGFVQLESVDRVVSGNVRALDPGAVNVVRITGAVNTPILSGVDGGVDGRLLVLLNGSGATVTIAGDTASDAASTALENRLLANVATFFNGAGILLWYDGARSRWVVLGV